MILSKRIRLIIRGSLDFILVNLQLVEVSLVAPGVDLDTLFFD